ncbi:MAG: hypothetical protein LBV12_08210 [Puniceicoccales bacterium]|jgi:hypothetical protein|nr:hypothetical protein [Puniceicoccales bacterium]
MNSNAANSEKMREDAQTVLLRSLEAGRLPHGILLHGPNLLSLEKTCLEIASRLLGVEIDRVPAHPDFHGLRAANKMRRIGVEDTRELVRQIQHSSSAGDQKVAVIYDADRMVRESANTFLKTLEEPPPGCTIFLLTTKPTHLLDTVRSRCLHFHVESDEAEVSDPNWQDWLKTLAEWIASLAAPLKPARVAEIMFTLYGLASRFEGLLKSAADTEWEKMEATLPVGVSDEQKIALETGVLKNIRQRRLAEMADCLCLLYAQRPDDAGARALHLSLGELEKTGGLLEVNLNDTAAIEYILLRWLRAWSQR